MKDQLLNQVSLIHFMIQVHKSFFPKLRLVCFIPIIKKILKVLMIKLCLKIILKDKLSTLRICLLEICKKV